MAYHVQLAALKNMSKTNSEKVLGELVASATQPRNGQAAVLDARIREYELLFEMSSDEMKSKLALGQFKETAEVANWLFLLRARSYGGAR